MPNKKRRDTPAPRASAVGSQQRFEHAFTLHRGGRHAEAFALYETVLAADPRHAPALHFSGLLLYQGGKAGDAIVRIERSLAIDDKPADVWSNAALVYQAAGRIDDAMRALEQALRREPTLVEAWLNLSSLRLDRGDAAGAEAAARRALTCGETPQAWFNLALALSAQGRASDALAALDRVDASGAIAEDDAATPGLRAQLLIKLARRDEARGVLDRALARVDHPALRIERARLAEARNEPGSALADYRAAFATTPGAHLNDELVLSELVFLKKRVADWEGLSELQTRFREGVLLHDRDATASALTPFSFLSDPSTRAEQRMAGEAWSRRYVDSAPSRRPLSEGRLRIGYLSADLHEHATGVLTVGLFEKHDRSAFEVFGYSTGPDDGSALRRRIVASFDHFVNAKDWTLDRLFETIHADAIDILVDLKGHTEQAPTAVMAARPAPIQVSYLGYPATMGAGFIDYLIGDGVVTSLEHRDDYSETLVQLPGSYQVNDDSRAIGEPPSRSALGLADDAFVFCCFNNVYKIGPDVLDAWMEILHAVPDSVLWMITRRDDVYTRENLRREVVTRGVEPARLIFADTRPHADYLALYRHADLFIDTWPYNAHTTASDALWAGCPVLTTIGETFAGRVAASLLTAVDMTELIAPDRARFIAAAIGLASDRTRLRALRERLLAGVRSSALFDTGRTARAIERAYRAMADQYRNGRREPIVIERDE
jgi:protein O-GlcNAc transferase